MKNKPQLSEEKLSQLKDQLKKAKITMRSLAHEAGCTERNVHYFFSGARYNKAIHDAAIGMLNKRVNQMMHELLDTHQSTIKLQQAS